MSQPARCRVELSPAAQRQLRRLPPGEAARLRAPILALAIEPRPRDSTPLVGTSYLRLRLRDLRVVYLINDPKKIVAVLRVARRSESTYRGLG
ncbi:MAG: type II toxin-antitoxin system RelE/ParE family toxin [Chloroflexota bacterium]